MKKIISILFTLQIFIISILGIKLVENIKLEDVFKANSTDIMISIDGVNNIQDFGTKLTNIAKNNNIYISRKVYAEENRLQIYSTDCTLNNKIILREGVFPSFDTDNYIADKKYDESKQVGLIEGLSRENNIIIQGMNNVDKVGIAGLYSISSTDNGLVNHVIEEILNINKDILRVHIIGTNDNSSVITALLNGSTYSLINNLLTLVVLPCVILSILLLSAFYINKTMKTSYIYKIHGYSNSKICFKYTSKIIISLVLSAGFSFVILAIINMLFIKAQTKIFLYVLLLPTILFIFIYSLYFYLLLYFALRKESFMTILKGKQSYKAVTFMQYFTKFIFTIVFFVLLVSTVNIYKVINTKLNNLSVWMKTQNIYQTTLNATGRDYKIELQNAKKIQAIMKDLDKYNKGFVCNADNYEKVGDTGKYIYELNGTNGYPMEASPGGPTITVSENYFNFNPIKGVDNKSIKDEMIYDDNVLNILVPIDRKKYESSIKEAFREDFWFEKVDVENIYNEKLGKPLNKMKKEELSINIIYVENNQGYFTFNESIDPESKNTVFDPIVKIYTGNIDPSFALSAYSSNFYFYSDKIDAFDSILPILVKNNATNLTSSVIPLYDEYGKEVNELKYIRNNLTILMIIIFIANIAVLYSVMSLHYEKNKYKLYLQKIFGYTFFKKNKNIMFILTIITCVPMVYFLFTKNIIFLLCTLGYLAFEYFIIFVLDQLIGNKSFNSIIKGEH